MSRASIIRAPGYQEDAILIARPMGIDTYQEPVIYMRADCPVCLSEGFESHSRIEVQGNDTSLTATLNVVHGDFLQHDEAGLSESAWALLGSDAPCPVTLRHSESVESFRYVRSKLFGHDLSRKGFDAIVGDVAKHRYSDVQMSAFLSACAGEQLSSDEIVDLTRAMVHVGERLSWPNEQVFDKHCVGGLPGNRTTPIVVAIATAFGVIMPKTSSRAITSPAGTADTMETLTNVDLSLADIRRVVEQEGGCLAWGGSVNLSPADDVFIRIERALDLDSEAQLIASVLSKKLAAGSTHVLIDIPTGPTAKVRDRASAERLSNTLRYVGSQLGMQVDSLISNGDQPVGRGIGPALEAFDVLAVLRGDLDAPQDLKSRAVVLAGRILELSGKVQPGDGIATAIATLRNGRAWQKFQAICDAQGGIKTPTVARYQHPVLAHKDGRITHFDNRRLARVAKLAGAPTSPAAGLYLHAALGDSVAEGMPIMTVHAEAPGSLAYALKYLEQHVDVLQIDESSTAVVA